MKIQDDWRRDSNSYKQACRASGLCKTCSYLFLYLLTLQPKTWAQQERNYTIQANIIYRFTKYIDWPKNKKTGDFIIGIVGDSPLTSELKNFVSNKMVGTQPIIVKRFSSPSKNYNCHILFISEEMSSNIKKIVLRTAGEHILLVSESEGMAVKGSCINFVIVSDHLKLEINKNIIEQRNLGIASELLQLGKIVK